MSMLESATHFSLVLVLDRFFYQLLILRSSFFVVIVSATPQAGFEPVQNLS